MVHHSTHTQRTSRGGFTLVELLVVMLIIAILVSLTFRVLSASMENARTEATRTTIRHLDSALQDRIEDFERVNFKPLATRFKAIFESDNGVFLPMELALVMVKKDRFRAAFPQREEDLWGFDGQPGHPFISDDSPLLLKMSAAPGDPKDTNADGWKDDTWKGRNGASVDALAEAAESSELLYVALMEGAIFGSPPPALDRIPQRHIGDTDRDGNLEFLDDWGQPLRFYNWTTRLIRPGDAVPPNNNDISQAVFTQTVGVLMPDVIRPTSSDPMVPSGPLVVNDYSHPLNQDPDDVFGALGEAIGAGTFPANEFTYNGTSAKRFSEAYYHTPDTYHIPLIVSAGPDGKVGLWEPDASDPRTPTAAAPAEADYKRRLGLPLGIDPTSPTAPNAGLLDLLYDNITNRQP